MSRRKEIFMEILRFKKDEFNLEGFMHYYNDNIEELTFEYPRYVSRICLIDKDYMDVITIDEDYENIDSERACIYCDAAVI